STSSSSGTWSTGTSSTATCADEPACGSRHGGELVAAPAPLLQKALQHRRHLGFAAQGGADAFQGPCQRRAVVGAQRGVAHLAAFARRLAVVVPVAAGLAQHGR